MAYCPIIGNKNYSDLKDKLQTIPTLKEKIIFLENEKLNTERILRHLKNKKHSLITFVRYKGRMISINCPELHDISAYISEINSKKIDYIKRTLGPLFIFYKYGYIYPFYNFILYLQGYKFFKRIYSEYLFLLKQEIKLCEKQITLGFENTPIKTARQSYDVNEPVAGNINRLLTGKVTEKEMSEQEKYSKIKIVLKKYFIYKPGTIDERFGILFITKKQLLDALYSYDTTSKKLIFLLDVRNNLSRIKNDFDNFKASSFDQEGIYLFRLANTSPELVYFIEETVEKSKKSLRFGTNLYLLKTYIEFKAELYGDVLALIDSQIEYFEKRLSLEKNCIPKLNSRPGKAPQLVNTKKSAVKKKQKNVGSKITWLGTEKQLIDLFFLLSESKLMPLYEEDEIVAHFVNARLEEFKLQEKINYQKLKWLGNDEDFPELISKLADARLIRITKRNKYIVFKQHFLNQEGKEFRYLAQKNQPHKNHARHNPLIDDAIKQILEDEKKHKVA